ncbi:hypothetical protein N6B72_07630 [Chryseobacterium soli]|uniref:hypothetical protein n=1 Tax=Chryseobacterium soli TaxID=445961 RepID=UPI0029538A75|nr:hypothetical protein [Chryseobacterium soli]MDV7696785.1 hypothetical protein [Chryseobacterium soli]
MSVDPLADITVSPYAYVWNDPVNFADPTGMMGERVGGQGHGPKTIKDCFGGSDNYGPDPLPKHMRTAAIRIAAAGINSVGNGQFKGNSGAEQIMNSLMIDYAGSHNMTLGQMASMQNEISQFYQGLGLVKGWHKETYEELNSKVIKNLKLNHEGVQYGTVKAIKEAENNWGILGMAGETAAFIMTEGLMPTTPTSKGPKVPYSSSKHYQNILDLNGEVEVMGDYAMFSFKGYKGNGSPDMIVAGKLEPNGNHLDFQVDILPKDVWDGKMGLKEAYTTYKNNVGIGQYRSFIEKWAKGKGFKTIRYYNKRATGSATGRTQSSKIYKF